MIENEKKQQIILLLATIDKDELINDLATLILGVGQVSETFKDKSKLMALPIKLMKASSLKNTGDILTLFEMQPLIPVLDKYSHLIKTTKNG